MDKPGEWLANEVRGKRVGVYGMDYVMTVRDHAALQGACELVGVRTVGEALDALLS